MRRWADAPLWPPSALLPLPPPLPRRPWPPRRIRFVPHPYSHPRPHLLLRLPLQQPLPPDQAGIPVPSITRASSVSPRPRPPYEGTSIPQRRIPCSMRRITVSITCDVLHTACSQPRSRSQCASWATGQCGSIASETARLVGAPLPSRLRQSSSVSFHDLSGSVPAGALEPAAAVPRATGCIPQLDDGPSPLRAIRVARSR